jgi:PQQ enzyme repeat
VDDVVYISELAGYFHCLDARTGKRYWVYDTKSCIWGSAFYADRKVYLGNEDGDVFVFRHDPKPAVLESPMDAAQRAASAAMQNARPGVDAKVRDKEAREAGVLAKKQAQQRIEERVLIRKVEMEVPLRSTPSAVGETLYIGTEHSLFAIARGAKR